MPKRLRPCSLLVMLLLQAVLVNAQTGSSPGKFQAGFKTIRVVDSSRIFKTGSSDTDYLHYRPVDLDIWYPAQPISSSSPLLFKDILGLLETRANYHTASTQYLGLTGQVAKSFADFFKCSDSARILQFKTASYANAPAVKGTFPLVVYLASYNSMAYENTWLLESLARKGYWVLAISSNGRYPGEMTTKKEDLLEQVQDAVFAVRHLSADSRVNTNKIGIVGYSWGGLAGTLLASRLKTAACLVSLEGSEYHHYGSQKQEDENFDDLVNSPSFKQMQLSLPYLRMEQAPANNGKQDTVYNFAQKLSTKAQVLVVDAATHHDFSYLPVLANTSGGCKNKEAYRAITALTIGYLDAHVGNKKVFGGVLQKELNQTVRRK